MHACMRCVALPAAPIRTTPTSILPLTLTARRHTSHPAFYSLPPPPLLVLLCFSNKCNKYNNITAESSARSAVKLEEMTRLLERLAMDKVAEGDDAGARQVLQVGRLLQETSWCLQETRDACRTAVGGVLGAGTRCGWCRQA